MTTRAERRAHRERIIRRRAAEVVNVLGHIPPEIQVASLAANRVLGCPDGRNCPFCRRPKSRAERRREVQNDINACKTQRCPYRAHHQPCDCGGAGGDR